MGSESTTMNVDYLIVGAGVAGLSAALKLAEHGRVLLLSKGSLEESNSWYAQGGIASVFDPQDSLAAHVDDTLTAGAGLCHQSIVELVVGHGPEQVRTLQELGAQFTTANHLSKNHVDASPGRADLHLTQEGGHSHRRVVHAADVTGKEIVRALLHHVKGHAQIEVRTQQTVIDLITTDRLCPVFGHNRCRGAYVLDRLHQRIYAVQAAYTILCTGGHGKAYLYTSNPDSATGDGLAIGWRAGCKVANLEFMQFHPTCLFHPRAKTFLISEALRGEGARLMDVRGRDFMQDYHPLASLAPRDIVARAIDSELKRTGASHVFLDARHLGAAKIQQHFPTILAECLKFGIDIREEMIPVVPAAHYSCGGLVTDADARTSVEGLYAVGEVACTGLHGANRLASNSLLEAVVFADQAARHISAQGKGNFSPVDIPPWKTARQVSEDELVVLAHAWDEIRRLMWHYVGIVRSEKRLRRALDRITVIRRELDDYYWHSQVGGDLLEVRNLALVSWLTIRCAMARKESRGIHYMIDYPETSLAPACDTVLQN